MQNIVNQQCIAGAASVYKNTGIDRGRVSISSVFYLLKKAKNVLDAKNNNFHFLRF